MRLRTEDALGFFSTQMLGQLALPSVAREAAARAVSPTRGRVSGKAAAMQIAKEVWPGAGTDSSTGLVPAADTKPQAGANDGVVPPSLAARARRLIEHMRARNMPAPPAHHVFVRCDCSRVVPLTEWDLTNDCCSDCADRSAAAGDNWRDYMREQDCLRLLGEFTD